jgi:hypothetical protein
VIWVVAIVILFRVPGYMRRQESRSQQVVDLLRRAGGEKTSGGTPKDQPPATTPPDPDAEALQKLSMSSSYQDRMEAARKRSKPGSRESVSAALSRELERKQQEKTRKVKRSQAIK